MTPRDVMTIFVIAHTDDPSFWSPESPSNMGVQVQTNANQQGPAMR